MDEIIENKLEFSELINRHHARLYGYIHALLRDLHDADDVMQKTTMVLWNKFESYDRSRDFFSWACGVARFEVKNFIRQQGRDRHSFSDELTELLIESHVDQVDTLDRQSELLTECLKKLNETDRDLMERCYRHDYSISDAAAALGRSTHSIHNSLRRIRRLLYQCVSRSLALE